MVRALPRRIHCVGVAGGGLSALAGMLADAGHRVSGSDVVVTGAAGLDQRGVTVRRGHAAAHVGSAELLIRSAAVPDDNPEVVAARRRRLPVLKYSEALGRLMQNRFGIAIAGTHGKTTTTALVAHLLRAAGVDAGWVVGGRPLTLPGSSHLGADDAPLVVEACEYDDSYLNLSYDVGVVLGVSVDHLDWFGDEAGVYASFGRFAAAVPRHGTLVLGEGVPVAAGLRPSAGAQHWSVDECVRLGDVREDASGWSGTVITKEGAESFRLPLLGRHNLGNLRAAVAALSAAGVALSDALPGLADFTGVARRLQVVGHMDSGAMRGRGQRAGRGAVVIDDFAHHPEALVAAASAARGRYPGRRLLAVFQPHQVCRTADFLDAFALALKHFDSVLLCDIFVARDARPERAEGLLKALVERAGQHVRRVGPAAEAEPEVRRQVRPDDVCLVMGAGDIDGLAGRLGGASAGP